MKIRVFRINSKLIEFSWAKLVNDEIFKDQLSLKRFLEMEYHEGIKEIRIGYHTLALRLRIDITIQDAHDILQEFAQYRNSSYSLAKESKVWKVPICYDLNFGFDLSKLSELHKIDIEEIVRLHSFPTYRLHFFGFLPGFMYLAGLPENLHTPRKANPDRSIPKGTMAIGGGQTGIYPQESPGGWHAIGRYPFDLFEIKKQPPVPMELGDQVKFIPISTLDFKNLQKSSSLMTFQEEYD